MADTVFEAEGKISLDSSGVETGLSKVMSSVSTAAKTIGALTAAAVAAVGSLVKQSVAAYSSYEQLVGGVETLFGNGGKTIEEYAESVGKSVADVTEEYEANARAEELIFENAANAYATAGMSMNEYMETATSFAASLVNSLGGDTEKAAELADVAISDMSDNANKMGTTMELIQNAYNGFAKQNYTMLDNLKLGYGGTKEEMERLLAEAEAISGVEYDVSSYSDIVEAIHVIQQEMGITGTTAAEAGDTITGSLASVKAAWENILVGMADDTADFDTMVDNLVSTATAFVGNIIPRIESAISGVGKLVSAMAPVIAEQVPALVEEVLPDLLEAAETLVSESVNAIAENIPSILSLIPQIVSTILELMSSVIDTLTENVDTILPAVFDGVIQIVTSLTEILPEIITGIIKLLAKIAEWFATDGVQMLISVLPGLIESMVSALLENLPVIIECGAEIVVALIEGILKNLPEIIEAVIQILIEVAVAIIENLPVILQAIDEAIVEIVLALFDALSSIESALEVWGAKLEIVTESWLQAIWNDIWAWFSDKMPKTAAVLEEIAAQVSSWMASISSWVSSFFETLSGFISHFFNSASSVMSPFISSVMNVLNTIYSAYQNFMSEMTSTVWNWLENFFDSIISETLNSLWQVYTNNLSWFAQMISAVWNFGVQIIQTIQNILTSIVTVGKNFIEGLWEGINEKFQWLKKKIVELGQSIVSLFKTIFGIHSPSKVFRDEIGKNLALGIGVGFTTNIEDVKDQMANALDFGEMTQDIAMNATGTTSGTYSTASAGEDGSSSSVYTLLAQYLPGLSKLKVVMDTGELVGVLADPLDLALGKMAALGV